MTHLRRIIVGAMTLLSLVLFASGAVLWVQSYRHTATLPNTPPAGGYWLLWGRGGLVLVPHRAAVAPPIANAPPSVFFNPGPAPTDHPSAFSQPTAPPPNPPPRTT